MPVWEIFCVINFPNEYLKFLILRPNILKKYKNPILMAFGVHSREDQHAQEETTDF